MASIRQVFKHPLALAGASLTIIAAACIVVLFVGTTRHASAPSIDISSSITDNETAYQNVLQESLKVYKARYGSYPKSYQILLDDMKDMPDIYGVNDEGLAAMSQLASQLTEFSYIVKEDGSYQFTYRHQASGKVETVTND